MTNDSLEYEDWIKKAEYDIGTAEINLANARYDAAAFYCQQAIEKALKALYIKQKSDLIKTHDLNFLGRKVGLPDKLLKICNKISAFYVESRYPDSLTKFDEDVVASSIKDAREVIGWVKKKI